MPNPGQNPTSNSSTSTTKASTGGTTGGSTAAEGSVRRHYETAGIAGYYSSTYYENPHEERVQAVLRFCFGGEGEVEDGEETEKEAWRRDLGSDGNGEDGNNEVRILDSSAGNGEVTNALMGLVRSVKPRASGSSARTGRGTSSPSSAKLPFMKIWATDPFTHQAYDRRFKDVPEWWEEGDSQSHSVSGKKREKKGILTGNVIGRRSVTTSKTGSSKCKSGYGRMGGGCQPISFEDILERGLFTCLGLECDSPTLEELDSPTKPGPKIKSNSAKSDSKNNSSTSTIGCISAKTGCDSNPTNALQADNTGNDKPDKDNPNFSNPSPLDLTICSYALHLATAQQLPVLAMQLALASKRILIITPHKRPRLQEAWGWRRVNEVVICRTRAVLYESLLVGEEDQHEEG